VADRRRLSRLQVGVVSGKISGVALGLAEERLGVGKGLAVQGEQACSGRKPQGDPEDLAPRAPGRQPSCGAAPDTPGQLGLA